MSRTNSWVPRLLVIAALGIVAMATLFPDPREAWLRDFWCLRCHDSAGMVDVVLNVLLYFLAMVLTPWLRARADRAAALAAPSGPRHRA